MPNGLEIIHPGLFTTIQDLGRFGFQDLGVPPSGALDTIGLRLANALVGNAAGEACLEISYMGPVIRVAVDSVRIAVSGKVRLAIADGGTPRPVDSNRSHRLKRGDTLTVGAVDGASTAYLAIEGGFALAPVMGSLSSYGRAGLGPLGGRPPAAGTILPLRLAQCRDAEDVTFAKPMDYGQGPIRVVLGPQADAFTQDAVATLLASIYRVTQEADRMGLRLEGSKLAHRASADIASDGLVSGCIQVPGSGAPIIVLADHQTVGGYAKIATVISADLPRLGRVVPGTSLTFAAQSVAEAEAIRRAQEREIERLIRGIIPVPSTGVDLDALYGADLISGMVDAVSGQGR
ncbi:Allophanate hydrolase 2 subunit 2 [Paramagnetospirillum magnetotacticum MS-1]|uniref:Allophanate hydrolase 2 subunit 2 n=1 Tax=Paramagnetospirillum magnetotacticum MS-1 TaxID=272627 RepID=A0A0C2YUS8_PARME|nr:biotin-dependent carboxyltransferase family protein [Paramagnetospirillum magnetotacticum]KIL98455.1 Allophanate hydrolase 2 subunit 2 [Paramagnetospirillum magnetotacticum MS-1]